MPKELETELAVSRATAWRRDSYRVWCPYKCGAAKGLAGTVLCVTR